MKIILHLALFIFRKSQIESIAKSLNFQELISNSEIAKGLTVGCLLFTILVIICVIYCICVKCNLMEKMICCKGKTAYLAVNSQEQKVSTPTNEFYKNRNRI